MKTVKTVRVNFLRIYPVEREVTSTNGVKGIRAGALVLIDEPAAGVTAIELSPKQLTNLASMHGIRTTGRESWNDLAVLTGVGKSVATVSCEEHKAGDKYVDKDGNEAAYQKTYTACGVDSIILPDRVTTAFVERVIAKNCNFREQDDLLTALAGVNESVIPGVQ